MTSRPYAEVIGDPIGHSKSPLIHNFWLGKLGIDAEYRATRVPIDGFADYLDDRTADPGWRGCNVTMPLKRVIAPLMQHIEWAADAIGAINCVHRVASGLRDCTGDNFDAEGFSHALDDGDEARPLAGKTAVLLGSGGAARAVRLALGDRYQAIGTVRVVSRARPDFLAANDLWYAWDERQAALSQANLLINATPLGMAGFAPLDLDCSPLSPGATVSDLVYAPVETNLLATARAQSCRVVDGLGMLIHQAALSFERFFGVAPPLSAHYAELRERLIA